MNQTRTFLLIAWLAVGFLLFQQWQSPAPVETPVTQTSTASNAVNTDAALPSLPSLPTAAPTAQTPIANLPAVSDQTVEIQTDVYRLTIDLKGISILRAELLTYPVTKTAGSPNVFLLDNKPENYFVARSGWLTNSG